MNVLLAFFTSVLFLVVLKVCVFFFFFVFCSTVTFFLPGRGGRNQTGNWGYAGAVSKVQGPQGGFFPSWGRGGGG